ncbi:MAG: hypothetical protein JW802_11220 [Campylobacterales bacterium]|nr:hypothetical protein [Campylobacterales bacterium]
MNQSAFTYKEHEIISTLPKDEAIKLFDSLMEKRYTVTNNFKDGSKCLVQKIKIDGFDEMVFKIPRSRSRRTWERMLTLFRESEAFRNHESMLTLETLGLKGAIPILAAQKRFRGVVLESFFTYSFVEGKAPKEEETPKVLEAMNTLHEKGYTRSDPKLQNFIMHEGEVYFIDFRLKKPRFFSKMERTLNLCKFFQTLPNDTHYMNREQKNSLFFKAMYRWNKVLMFWRRTRQKIKKSFAKK